MPIEVRYDDAGVVGAAAYQSGRDIARNQTLARMGQEKSRERQAELDRRHQTKMHRLRENTQARLSDRATAQKLHYSQQRSNQAREEMQFKEDLMEGRVQFASKQAEADFRRVEQKINDGLANGYLSDDEHRQAMADHYTRTRQRGRSTPRKEDKPFWQDPEHEQYQGKVYRDKLSGSLMARDHNGNARQIKDQRSEDRSRAYNQAMKDMAGMDLSADEMVRRATIIAEGAVAHYGPAAGAQETQEQTAAAQKQAEQQRQADEAAAAEAKRREKPAGQEPMEPKPVQLPASLVPPDFPESSAGLAQQEKWQSLRTIPNHFGPNAGGDSAERLSNFGDLMEAAVNNREEVPGPYTQAIEQQFELASQNASPSQQKALEASYRNYDFYYNKYKQKGDLGRLGLIEPTKAKSPARDKAETDYLRMLALSSEVGRAIQASVAAAQSGDGLAMAEAEEKRVEAEAAIYKTQVALAKKWPVLFGMEVHRAIADVEFERENKGKGNGWRRAGSQSVKEDQARLAKEAEAAEEAEWQQYLKDRKAQRAMAATDPTLMEGTETPHLTRKQFFKLKREKALSFLGEKPKPKPKTPTPLFKW